MNKIIFSSLLAGILNILYVTKADAEESEDNTKPSPNSKSSQNNSQGSIPEKSERHNYFLGIGLQLSNFDFLPILKTLDERIGEVAEELDTDVQYLSLNLNLESFANNHFPRTNYFSVASGVSISIVHPEITGVREDQSTIYPDNIPPLDLYLKSSLQLYSFGMGITPQFYQQEGKIRAAIIFPLRISAEIMRTFIDYKAEPVNDFFRSWFEKQDVNADGSISILGHGIVLSTGLGVEFGYDKFFCRNVIGKRWYSYNLKIDSDTQETVNLEGDSDTLDLLCGVGF